MHDPSRCARESRLSVCDYSRIDPTWRYLFIVVLLTGGLLSCSARPNVFSEPRDERLFRFDQEHAQLRRTNNPIRLTKIYIRISDLRISFVGDAITLGDFEMMEEHLDGYKETVKDARNTMMNSDRDAASRAAGFRELEIALRQHMRQLDDIGGRLTFQYREPIEKVINYIAEIRDELLKALFPEGGRG